MLDGNKIKVKETVKGKSLLLASEHRDLRIGLTHLNVAYYREPREWETGRDSELGKKEKGEHIFMCARSQKQRSLL